MWRQGLSKHSTYLAAGLISLLISTSTLAAGYPTKPVELVAPYGPGGSADLAARTLASVAPKYLGQPVLVIDKAGASGVVGSTYVHNARPDGYVLLLARVGSQAAMPAISESIPYKWNDFTMLGLLDRNPYVFVVNANSPYKSFADLVQALKQHPGKLSYGTAGPGSILTVGPELLFDILGLKNDAATMVPYKGGGPAKAALLGGHVDFMGVNLVTVLGAIEAGKLRALAITTPKRYEGLAHVPTVAELGYPQLQVITGWSALYGPPNLPKEVVTKWQRVLRSISKDKTWLSLEKKLGSVPDVESPEKTYDFAKTQYDTYHKLAEKIGLTVN